MSVFDLFFILTVASFIKKKKIRNVQVDCEHAVLHLSGCSKTIFGFIQ